MRSMQDAKQLPDGGEPIISVIVPVYKVERFLAKCVDSILNQTYPRLEVILVDDGSPDGCPAICDDYARKDNRVRVVHQQNGGLSAARNAGLDIAGGEYIAFVDSDDYIQPDAYEKLFHALGDAEADLAVCNYRWVDTAGNTLPDAQTPITDGVLIGRDDAVRPLGQDNNWYWVVAWNKLYKRRLFDTVRFPVGKLHEDEFVIHRILLQCERVACVSDALYNYVQHQSGITRSGYSLRRLDGAEALFDRAMALSREGVDPATSYYACASGLMVMGKGYTQLKLNDPDYKRRYKELTAQYRQAARPLLKARLPVLHKARLALNCLSPYHTWRLLEQRLRRARDETADTTQPA